MPSQSRLTATLEEISLYTTRLEMELSDLPLESRTTVVLAVHELLVNIVRHAYNGVEGMIDIEIEQSPKEIQISIRDYAEKAFTMPDEINAPDLTDLPENGMGLFIIQTTFETVKYHHLAPGNIWELRKKLGG